MNFRQSREGGREASMCGCLSWTPTEVLAHNPGVCPDWEPNWQPFGSQAGAQSTEPHQPGPHFFQMWELSHKPVILSKSVLCFLECKTLRLRGRG